MVRALKPRSMVIAVMLLLAGPAQGQQLASGPPDATTEGLDASVAASVSPLAALLSVPQWNNANSAVGVNVDRVRPQSTEIPFANLFKKARHWQQDTIADGCGNNAYSNYPSGLLDSNGYPTTVASVCNYTDLFNSTYSVSFWPLGEYELRYDGTAVINATGPVSAGGTAVANGGTFTVDDTTGPLQIEVLNGPGVPINMRLYPPGGVCAANASPPYDVQPHLFCSTPRCPGGICPDAVSCPAEYQECVEIASAAEANELTFHPLWLSRLGQFRAIRFMDWNGVNRQQPATLAGLADREAFTYSFYRSGSPRDVPPEVIGDLCNLLSPIECWVNIPHALAASDLEAAKFFDFYRDYTDPGVLMMFELSNEAWNGGFNQGREMAALADALDDAIFDGDGCCNGTNCSPADAVVDIGKCADSYYGMRTIELANLAEASFDATNEDDRLQFVFARHAASTISTIRALECEQWLTAPGGRCGTPSNFTHIDLYTIAGYFGSASLCDTAPDIEALCANLDSSSAAAFSGSGQFLTHDTLINTSYGLGLPLATYEAGQAHFQFPVDDAVCAAIVAQPDSCIGASYVTALDHYRDLVSVTGLDVRHFMQFNSGGRFYTGATDPDFGNNFGLRGSIYGSWPKESGLLNWINRPENDCWWTGCELTVPEPSMLSSLIIGVIALAALTRSRRST